MDGLNYTVAIPREFFAKERDAAYSDWRQAIWREFLQNSIDAGSTEVLIEITQGGSGPVDIIFQDNGCGMTRDVLENVYFQLGKSTKGAGSLGGFGRARILTSFAMDKYAIHTLDNFVHGSGAQYSGVQDADEFFQGVAHQVTVSDVGIDVLRDRLETFLGECNLPAVAIYINGELWEKPADLGVLVRDLTVENEDEPFAQVYYNKNHEPGNSMVTMVSGLSMFNSWCRVPGRVTVCLDPKRSRELLISNRDDLRPIYRRAVQDFLSEIAVDTTSALKAKRTKAFHLFAGTGFSTTNAKSIGAERIEHEGTASGLVNKTTIVEMISQQAYIDQSTQTAVSGWGGAPQTFAAKDFLPTTPFLMDHTDSIVIAAAQTWDPDNWNFQYTDGRLKWKGCSERVRLLLTWKAACQAAVDALATVMDMDAVAWAAGWTFSDTHAACCHNIGYRTYGLLLMPINSDGKFKYQLSEPNTLNKLLAIAAHEAVHTKYSYHDEDYANVLTEVTGLLDQTEFKNAVKKIKL